MKNEIRMTVTVDSGAAADEILLRAIQGLRRSTEYCLGRAKYHAPVRAIFKRTRRGPPIPKGRDVAGWEKKGWRYIRSESQYQRFKASKERRFGMNLPAEGGEIAREQGGGSYASSFSRMEGSDSVSDPVGKQLKAIVNRDKEPGRKSVLERIGSERLASRSAIGGQGRQFSGHANTLFPVLTQPGGRRVTGDLRKVGSVGTVFQRRNGVTGMFPSLKSQLGSKRTEVLSGRASMLSSGGRWELKSKRALYQGRIGGKLRGEIRIEGPFQEGKMIWMEVVSPTLYAAHQEFGTTHNRPNPFLRPALYESREILRGEVRKAVMDPSYTRDASGKRVSRLDRGGDGRTSSKKRMVN